jgi:hypothetical protein
LFRQHEYLDLLIHHRSTVTGDPVFLAIQRYKFYTAPFVEECFSGNPELPDHPLT